VVIAVAFGGVDGLVRAADKSFSAASPQWDRQAAAGYLDRREAWWQNWDHSQRDHGTRCVSCHTQAPYALARPTLRRSLGEMTQPIAETAMLADVEKRVLTWDAMLPFYPDEKFGKGKGVESRNAEAVLNAIILASYDVGRSQWSETTRLAFAHAWALQSASGPDAGAWVWQDFDYAPWESKESQYHWAALLAIAAGEAPAAYRRQQGNAEHVDRLLSYLQSHYEQQPLLNKVVALWATPYFPDLLAKMQREALLRSLSALQRPDGGWCLADMETRVRRDETPQETRSDGYATAIVTLALEELPPSTVPPGNLEKQIQGGLDWLIAHQDKSTGAWPAWSLNKNRDPQSDAGLFMTDAATGYAVMALEAARH
jgi:hypothetical protein